MAKRSLILRMGTCLELLAAGCGKRLLPAIVASALLVLAIWRADGWAAQRKITEEELCQRADVVAIGKVISGKSYYRPDAPEEIVTLVSFQVEILAHGVVPPVIEFPIAGGQVDDDIQHVVSGPYMPIGSRHLVFLDRFEKRTMLGTPLRLIRWLSIPPDAEVPDAEEAQDIWEEHCTLGPHDIEDSHPTERYLALIPPHLLQWCQHY